MRFEFATATQIIFGPGVICEAGAQAAKLGKHALVVTGANPSRAAPLLDALAVQGIAVTTFSVPREPLVETVRQGVQLARQQTCDLVIGFGGGSALDTGKAIAALAANPGDVLDYLEVIGKGQALLNAPLPFIAIPTTAGTGTEVTRNAVIGSPEHGVKVSLRSPLMLPRLALVDPELTHGLPPAVTASTGLDALTQLIEPFTCNKPNPLVDALCRDGIARSARSLHRAYESDDPAARQDLSYAALLSGLALANAGLGAVHGFAGPLGGELCAPDGAPASHGTLCARLLPFVVAANIRALETRQPESQVLSRYDEVAQLLTGNPHAHRADGVAFLHQLCADLHIPQLSTLRQAQGKPFNPSAGSGQAFTSAQIPALVQKAARASSMKANPLVLTEEEMAGILTEAL
jgi:alcohol dehydrogenase class IV